MEERAFSTIIQSVTPVGKEFQNPGGGKSTIISHSHTGLYYQRGRSLIRFRYRDDAYGDVSGYNRRWQIGRCRRVLDGALGVGAWRRLRLVSVRIPRSSTGNLVSVQGGFC